MTASNSLETKCHAIIENRRPNGLRKRTQWKIERWKHGKRKEENSGEEERHRRRREGGGGGGGGDSRRITVERKGKKRKGSCNLSSRSRPPSWGWLSETLTTVLFEDVVVDRRDIPLDISILENCAANRMLRVRVARASWSGRSSRRYIYIHAWAFFLARTHVHTFAHFPSKTTYTVLTLQATGHLLTLNISFVKSDLSHKFERLFHLKYFLYLIYIWSVEIKNIRSSFFSQYCSN